ncbi:MAG: glutamyl-tRNA reductase, partial [Bacteroidota bacterium]
MNITCVGISHHTAPLEQRERLWFSPDEIRSLLPKLADLGADECVVFSTCNRTEVYVSSTESDPGPDVLKQILLQLKPHTSDIPQDALFTCQGAEATRHLFSVASGIDSMVVGDVQILSQIKEGLHFAVEKNTAGFFMNKLFQSAFHAGKRARTETKISEG